MARQQQIVQNRQPGKQLQVLKRSRNAHVRHLMRRRMGEFSVPVMNRARCGMIKPGNAIEHACFAGTVRAND